MSCNCQQHHQPPMPFHDCSHINHVFDPPPPTFYGTWNHLRGHDIRHKVSVALPGIASGLYRNDGPLNCSCCGNINMLTGVTTQAKIILSVSMHYTNTDLNATVDIEPGRIYTFNFLEDGNLCQCTGLVTNIYRVSQLDETTQIYKINIDCSTQYSHNTVVIKSDQIRGVNPYIPYADEDSSLSNAYHVYGTTIAQTITNAVVINAELDKERNLVKGTIIQGTIQNGQTLDGLCVGENSNKHTIVLNKANSKGGNISDGFILNGSVTSGDIDGEVEEETGYISHATIKGTLSHVVAINTTVTEAIVPNNVGEIIQPTIENTTVYEAEITGEDMITTGGITCGNLTTNGITTGGTGVGGTAFGIINGKAFTIFGGTTVGDLVTSGGTLIGGTVIGGNKIGNVIYNATVKGGIVLSGVTTGGTTTANITIESMKSFYKDNKTGSAIVPGTSFGSLNNPVTPVGKMVLQNPNWSKVTEEVYRNQLKYPLDRYDSENIILSMNGHTQHDINFGAKDISHPI